MLNSSPIMAFSATSKPAEALVFYRDTLGLELVEDTPFAIVFDAHGTSLRVQKVPSCTPPSYTVVGWQVQDLSATVDHLLGGGVVFERFPGLPQDDHGVWSAPDGAQIAWLKDPDGNLLSLTQLP